MKKAYEQLFEPFTFKSGVTIQNRLLMAPMTTNSSLKNGMLATDEILYYARRSGDVGAVITACAHIRDDGKFAASPSISSDLTIESLSILAKRIQDKGSKAILQIFHVGRMGSSKHFNGQQPVSASAVPPMREGAETPRELTSEEVEQFINEFAEATRRAIQAGFDGVEIHGANTYLIQQFFSPHSNRREDYWGGSLEKRMHFPIEVVNAVKHTIEKYAKKPFIFGYRISPEEIEEPGITLDDTLALMNELKVYNLDYFHVSLSNILGGSIRDRLNKDSVLKTIQDEIGSHTPIIGVGNVITPDDAIDAMEETGVPLVAVGRQLITDPDWVAKVRNGEQDSIRKVLSYKDNKDLMIPDTMWEYMKSRPGWLPIID
ncbi:MAG TPA: NADH-dependent flavin oxidoreductase [Atopostipes sp.]|nr:NADH-dependent flavin oxidoreductase [Atopostipes sp.]